MSTNIVITVFSSVTVILLFTIVDVSSESATPATNSNACHNKTCTGSDCGNCSDFPVTLVLVSVVICLVPPITWGMVICYACKSDPLKRRRRIEQRRRRRAREALVRSLEENVGMNDLPPSYQEARNCPLYRPGETVNVSNNNTNIQNNSDGIANHAYSEQTEPEEPPPSYAYSANDNEDEGEPPPPSYAFAISGYIV